MKKRVESEHFLWVEARAGAKKDIVVKKKPDYWQISVRAPAARGEANRAILAILHRHFPQHTIKLIHGAHRQKKLFLIKR